MKNRRFFRIIYLKLIKEKKFFKLFFSPLLHTHTSSALDARWVQHLKLKENQLKST